MTPKTEELFMCRRCNLAPVIQIGRLNALIKNDKESTYEYVCEKCWIMAVLAGGKVSMRTALINE